MPSFVIKRKTDPVLLTDIQLICPAVSGLTRDELGNIVLSVTEGNMISDFEKARILSYLSEGDCKEIVPV